MNPKLLDFINAVELAPYIRIDEIELVKQLWKVNNWKCTELRSFPWYRAFKLKNTTNKYYFIIYIIDDGHIYTYYKQ